MFRSQPLTSGRPLVPLSTRPGISPSVTVRPVTGVVGGGEELSRTDGDGTQGWFLLYVSEVDVSCEHFCFDEKETWSRLGRRET